MARKATVTLITAWGTKAESCLKSAVVGDPRLASGKLFVALDILVNVRRIARWNVNPVDFG